MPSISFDGLAMAQSLYDLSKEILLSSTHLERDQLSSDRALSRSFDEIPPSRKGAAPDSMIYEQALDLVDQLGDHSKRRKIVFATSSTKDFCQNNTPKPPIDAELKCRGMLFCTNWTWIVNELGL
jgi:hypothetical protein